MENKVIITGIEPKIVRFRHNEGKCAGECSCDLELNELNRPILTDQSI